jgi:hypothetical protein
MPEPASLLSPLGQKDLVEIVGQRSGVLTRSERP